jgi:hypothetical protein
MPTPTITLPPTPGPNKYGGDPVLFDAAMQARLAWQDTATAEETVMVGWVNAQAATVAGLANATQADRIAAAASAAAVAAQSPVTNAAAAASAAAAAAASAAIAQAVSPDSPVRMNTRSITADLTIPSAYNAASVGPISIAPGITVTVQDNATWAIN